MFNTVLETYIRGLSCLRKLLIKDCTSFNAMKNKQIDK